MHGSNPTSQKEGKKRNFLVLSAGFIFLYKTIWDLIHYLPTGISSKVKEVTLQWYKVGHTADTTFAVAAHSLAPLRTTFLPMPRWLPGHFDSTLRSHNTIWLQQQKEVQRGELTIAVLTALPKKDLLVAYELISVTSGSIYETSLSRVANWCHKFQSPSPLRDANNENSSKSSNNFYCWLDGCLSRHSKLMADLRVLKNSCHREIHLQTNPQYASEFDLL